MMSIDSSVSIFLISICDEPISLLKRLSGSGTTDAKGSRANNERSPRQGQTHYKQNRQQHQVSSIKYQVSAFCSIMTPEMSVARSQDNSRTRPRNRNRIKQQSRDNIKPILVNRGESHLEIMAFSQHGTQMI
jgi:hypothetical protein